MFPEKYLYATSSFESISKIDVKNVRVIKSRGCQGRPKPTARELLFEADRRGWYVERAVNRQPGYRPGDS